MSAIEFIPQNILEQHLLDAVSDPSARPKFMETLLDSEVFVLPAGDPPEIVDGALQAESGISLSCVAHEGEEYVAFFSSEARMAEGTEYLKMAARDFFELTQGASLVLNPGSYGRTFSPDEVASLLDGSYFRPQESRVVGAEAEIQIGQPSEYPIELTAALSRLYAKMPAVRRAFLALYQDSSKDEEPGLLIAIEADSEAAMQRASAETGIVVEGLAKTHAYVDVTRFEPGGVADYFIEEKIAPFFERR